jgi:trimeric autotransporter adhesin
MQYPAAAPVPLLRRPRGIAHALATVATGLLGSAAVQSQCAPQWLPGQSVPGVNGVVRAMTEWDPDGAGPLPPRIVVAGDFTVAGDVLANRIATYDPATGAWAALGTGMDNRVYALAVLPNGNLVAGGEFGSAGGVPALSLAIWNQGSSFWSALPLSGLFLVRALAVLPNGSLVVGGQTGSPVMSFAGGVWTSLGSAGNGWVEALRVLPNGSLVAGGSFTTIGGVAANHIASWNGAAWSPLGSGTNGEVSELAVTATGELVAAGQFLSAGGSPANHIASWNGTSWSPLGGGTNDRITGLTALPGGGIVAGGWFTTAGGTTLSRVARWDGSTWSALGNGVNGAVNAFAPLPNGDLFAGGEFTASGSVPTNQLARWNGSAWQPTSTGLTDAITSLATQANGELIAGGRFTAAGGVVVDHVARWNGSTWSPLGSGIPAPPLGNSSVGAVTTLPNGDVLAGGRFVAAGGVPALNIARWNGSAWSALGSGLPFGFGSSGDVTAIAALPNGSIVAGLTVTGAIPANSLRVWDGSTWSDLGGGLSPVVGGFPLPWNYFSRVQALLVRPNGDLIVAGQFTAAGGVPTGNIASWNGSTWSNLGGGMSGSVLALTTLPNGDLVAAGAFQTAGGTATGNVARWNGSAWSGLVGLGGANQPVTALAALPGGGLAAALSLPSTAGVGPSILARWNGSTWSTLGSGINATIWSLAMLPNGELIAGGDFTRAGGQPSAHFARLATPCPATVSQQGAACPGSGGANALFARTLPWLGTDYQTRATGIATSALVVAVHGSSAVSTPLGTLLPLVPSGCSLLVAPDVLTGEVATGGSIDLRLPLPNAASLAGFALHQQLVVLELDSSLAFVQITSTNALVATLGTF